MEESERPIIVLIDSANQMVHLYGNYNKSLPFDDVFLLDIFIENQDVYYVTTLENVRGEDIVNEVESLRDPSVVPSKKFIRSTIDDFVRIPDLKLTLTGLRDCKPLDKYGYDIFEKSPTLRKYIKEGKVEILSEAEVQSIQKKRPDKSLKDKHQSIILNKPVDKLSEENSLFDDSKMDMIDDSMEIMTEAESILKNHRAFRK
jgi:hypothetical protein